MIILIELSNLRTDFSVRALYTRQHNPAALLLITVLSLVRTGFILYALSLGAWLFAKRNRLEPSCREYDRYVFLWLMSLALITSFTNFAAPRWYTLVAASQIPGLLLFYLIIPQHNFWRRIFPGLSFTVIQLVLYATYKTPPPVFGFVSVYVGYVLSNVIGIVYSHRLYVNDRRNFALHRKKDRLTSLLIADKRKLQHEKELVAHYEAELRRQEVLKERLKALQAQIKPHFLFNSLSTIAYYCRTNSTTAYQLVSDLSTYLQSSFELQGQTVPWEDELRLVRAYLSIEAARMEERLSFSIETTGNLSGCRLPPFTVQPLVENAVRHGLALLPQGGVLKVTARETPEHYFFEVRDNGRGFDPTAPKTAVHPEEETSHGIGLANIEERLQGLYGSGLLIDSHSGAGTRVSFRIPKRQG